MESKSKRSTQTVTVELTDECLLIQAKRVGVQLFRGFLLDIFILVLSRTNSRDLHGE